MNRRALASYTPAMEFAGPVDFSKEIRTWRPAAKWEGRIKVGDVIEIEKVHQGSPGRFYARVLAMNFSEVPDETEALRLATIYPPGTPMICIRLMVEPGLDRGHPRFVTWETKTTKLARRIDAETSRS